MLKCEGFIDTEPFHAQDRFALNLGYDGLLTFNELMFDNYER